MKAFSMVQYGVLCVVHSVEIHPMSVLSVIVLVIWRETAPVAAMLEQHRRVAGSMSTLSYCNLSLVFNWYLTLTDTEPTVTIK